MRDMEPASALPDFIGPYRVLRPIARGGMAEVYEVEDVATGEHFALKLLVKTGGAIPRFSREYEAMIRLNHPNIVRVFHYGQMEDYPWLTMELVAGTPIQAYAKSLGKPGTNVRTQEVIRVAHDLALALDHIHKRGLVHRDLKSANVLVMPDGFVKLIDFGTARVEHAFEEITREGEFIGTFAYSSPEQITRSALDHRSDLYSFGVLLYRLATGKLPFATKDLHALAVKQVKERPRPPRQIRPSLPEALETIIMTLLEKKPDDRPASGAEVAGALEEVAESSLSRDLRVQLSLQDNVFTGRESQLSQLFKRLDHVQKGLQEPVPIMLLVGDRGSGYREALDLLEQETRDRSWTCIRWDFSASGSSLDILGQELAEMLGDSVAKSGKDLAFSERVEIMLPAVAALLSSRIRESKAPLMVTARSLELASRAGLGAVQRLHEECARRDIPLLLVGEVLENVDTNSNSLTRRRLERAERVAFPPLDIARTALLVGSLLNRRPPSGAVARKIHRSSGGLPGYVREVVGSMVSSGVLSKVGRDPNRIEWAQIKDMKGVRVSERAHQQILEHLATVPAACRAPLEALSLLDGEAAPKWLAAALGQSTSEFRVVLEEMIERGLVQLKSGPQGSMVHVRNALFSKVIARGLNPCRRRVFERRMLEHVKEGTATAAQVRLLIRCGEIDLALRKALEWSQLHVELDQPQTALEALEPVMDLVEESGLTGSERARLYMLHATSMLMTQPTNPATSRSLAHANELGRHEGDVFAAELHLLQSRIQRVIGHYPNFRDHLMHAWRLIEHGKPSSLGSTVAGLLGWSNRVAGAVDASASWQGRARRIAVQTGEPSARAHAEVGVAEWQYARGMLAESEATAVSALTVFDDHSNRRGISLVLPIWAASLISQGRFSEVFEVLNQHAPVCRAAEAPSQYVRVLLAQAWAEIEICRLGRAQECVDELGAALRLGEHLDLRLEADLVWGRILLASGQQEEALHRLHRVRSQAKNAGLLVICEWAGALIGETLWGLGDLKAAHQEFSSSVEGLLRTGNVPVTVSAVISASRAMAGRVHPERLFGPVEAFIKSQPAKLALLERDLARGRYARANDMDPTPYLRRAQEKLDTIKLSLNQTDAAALRLHPWSQTIRSGGLV